MVCGCGLTSNEYQRHLVLEIVQERLCIAAFVLVAEVDPLSGGILATTPRAIYVLGKVVTLSRGVLTQS